MHTAQEIEAGAVAISDLLAAQDRVLVAVEGEEPTFPKRTELLQALLHAGRADVAKAMRKRPAGAFVLRTRPGVWDLRVIEDDGDVIRQKLILRLETKAKRARVSK